LRIVIFLGEETGNMKAYPSSKVDCWTIKAAAVSWKAKTETDRSSHSNTAESDHEITFVITKED
jgi:hypothetical protein